MAWTVTSALNDPSIAIHARDDAMGYYRVTIGTLKTEVTIQLCRSPISDETRYERSHNMHTPQQGSPYHQSRLYWDDPWYALHQAVNSLTEWYDAAVNAGDKPKESWLVAIPFTSI